MQNISPLPKEALLLRRSRSGLGLFSAIFIPQDTFIIEYTGEKIPTQVADARGGRYLFRINTRWTIDGKGRENLSRYINHSCDPNCEVRIVKEHIYIFSKRKIQPGDELHYDYGEEYFNTFIKPKGCVCLNCTKKKEE